MSEAEKINILLQRLELLLNRHELFSKEISELQKEIQQLKSSHRAEANPVKEKTEEYQPILPNYVVEEKIEIIESIKTEQSYREKSASFQKTSRPAVKSDLEKFIGENLINKIGIIILVIGVAIGAKYAIDHDLINPLTRIILGYLVGLGLLGFAIKLKKDYENFSSVLLSGSMAIMYFITFAAYSFYGLFPQAITFLLMVMFTAFTVVAALNYDRQVIAIIGLTGAYAVPFLLSDGSGKVLILFSYMTIINSGILIISFKKYWKQLSLVSFIFSWLIYISWILTKYDSSMHFVIAIVFLSIFFVTFYTVSLSYKLIRKEVFKIKDVILILLNSFIFYGLGYFILDEERTNQLLGLFTLFNALIHFAISQIIYRKKLADKNLLYLIAGLVLVFITIAIPVQLDGNFVTLLWAGEAALLFWIGRTKGISFYEKLSYPLMAISFFSLLQDWSQSYHSYENGLTAAGFTPLLNVHFLSSIIFIVMFGFINYIDNDKRYPSILNTSKAVWAMAAKYGIPAMFLFVLYFSFKIEIDYYWSQRYFSSALEIKSNTLDSYLYTQYNSDLIRYRLIYGINYSFLFFSILSLINIRKLKNIQLGYVNLALNILCLATFLIQGLYLISELRSSYLTRLLGEYYEISVMNIYIRYISFLFAAMIIFTTYLYTKTNFLKFKLQISFDFLIHTCILWIASSELIHWMDMSASSESYKIGLSILWGVYALLLIVLGISKKKKHLRLAAIVLFSVTLIKLFVYDISHLNTIAKTIVFVILGVLLLVISFLYNKYKHKISDENKN